MQPRNAKISRSLSWSYYYSKLAHEDLMEFLILLESERWLYCTSYFRLHPPQEFARQPFKYSHAKDRANGPEW